MCKIQSMQNSTTKWQRFYYGPLIPLGEDGRIVTGSKEHIALSRRAAGEGMVLLKNEASTLPLAKGTKVALFGKASVDYVKGGGGSGNVIVAYIKNLCQAMEEKAGEGKVEVFAPLCKFYRENVEAQYEEGKTAGYTVEPEVPKHLFDSAANESDVAIISICRYSKEGWDRKGEENDGDFYLSLEEQKLVEEVKSRFARIVVVLNVGGMVDTSWFKEEPHIQSVLLAWQGGMEGASAEADILCGDVNPSGKLTDTFAGSFDDYPSSYNFNESDDYVAYTDDIFVGYRYFETIPNVAGKVNYPFGFGLSYTTFQIECLKVCEADGEVQISAKVINTGDVAGKEVIQVYSGARMCRLDMPKRELRTFAKTKLLAARESQILELRFLISDMVAYDEGMAAYVLQQGEYDIFVGNSVRNVEQVHTVEVHTECMTKQLKNRCVPKKLPCRLKADGSYEKLQMSEYEELHDTSDWPRKIGWEAEHILPNMHDVEVQKDRIRMTDVFAGEATLEEFLNGLTDDEVVTLVGGTPNRASANTRGYGGLDHLKLPAVMTADGPAGLRIRQCCGVNTTAFPVATLLACTWDEELLYEIGVAGAKEVKENNMGIWLTHGINIHRTPLCGRNFEYYSEDPLVSGRMAIAMIRGIQSQNISACVKHFCVNNKETNRRDSDSRVSERALREIYLKAFEMVVKESGVRCVMKAYNLINGTFTSESKDLLQGILREEWGFDGLVTTDWENHAEPYREYLAGNDVRMPYESPRRLKRAMQEGLISRQDLMVNVRRIMDLLLWLE